jgi:hypothetical protein
VAQGIDLMTKAASANYPEAQAQLGLMYAMGLGVEPNNMKAYDLLSKAVNALPGGTRRAVAEANRDAVLKRMSAGEQSQVAATAKAKPAETPAATTAAAKKPASETTTTAAATTAKATTTTKSPTTAPAATTPKTVTEAANKSTKAPEATTQAKATEATTAKAATTQVASAKAPEATTPANATPANATGAKATEQTTTKAATTQVASAKAPDAAPAGGAKSTLSGVRIQLISMPSEETAWGAWKQLSGKYSSHLSDLTPVLEQADLGTKGTFYRVQAGPFTTVAAAQERCTAMKQDGLDCLVVGKP